MAGDEGPDRGVKLKNRFELSFEEVTEYLKDGRMQIHKFPLGFILTEIKELPGERVLHVAWLAGERFEEWKQEAWGVLRKFSEEHGCVAIEAHCRPGLAESLKSLGFRTIKRTVRVDL
jgi:hypothetical protein